MSNPYFNRLGYLVVDGTLVDAADLNNPLTAIEEGFDKVDQDVVNCVTLDSTQTITGDKTFSGNIVYTGDVDASTATTFNLPASVTVDGDDFTTAVTNVVSGGAGLPDQTGNSGKVLGTNGSTASWVASGDTLPDQTGNTGKVLGTDGSSLSWVTGGGGGSADMSVTLADEEYAAVVYDSGLAGESMSFGHLILFTAGKWWKATNVSANQDTTTEDAGWARLGICGTTGTIQADDTITVVLQGKVRCDALYSWTSDCRCLFVGPTAGEMYPNANEGLLSSKCIVRIVGHPVSTTEIYFNPANNFFITSEVV